MDYEQIKNSRAYESLPFSEYVACWHSVPQDLMDRIREMNRRHYKRCHHIKIDESAFAMAWRNAAPEERERFRMAVETMEG